MGKISRKEFSEMTGIRHTHIPTYSKRGKIHLESDGSIDTSHPTNQEFISGRQKNIVKTSESKKDVKPIKPVKKKENKPLKAPSKKVTPKEKKKPTSTKDKKAGVQTIEDVEYWERVDIAENNKRKRDLEISIKEAELEKRKIDIEKKRGEAVPTEYVTDIIRTVSDGLRTSYYDATETIILLIGSRTKLSSEDTSYIRKQLNGVLNKSIDEGFDTAQKTLKAVAKDFSNKKGIGES